MEFTEPLPVVIYWLERRGRRGSLRISDEHTSSPAPLPRDLRMDGFPVAAAFTDWYKDDFLAKLDPQAQCFMEHYYNELDRLAKEMPSGSAYISGTFLIAAGSKVVVPDLLCNFHTGDESPEELEAKLDDLLDIMNEGRAEPLVRLPMADEWHEAQLERAKRASTQKKMWGDLVDRLYTILTTKDAPAAGGTGEQLAAPDQPQRPARRPRGGRPPKAVVAKGTTTETSEPSAAD